MPVDLKILGDKIRRYRVQFELSVEEVAKATGLSPERLNLFETGATAPTGDELLILSDYFKCDYQILISSDAVTPLDRTDTLFRRFGDDFSKADRWSVQEFLYLCEAEAFVQSGLGRNVGTFAFKKKGTYFKGHAEEAAKQLRAKLTYPDHAVPRDVYSDFRSIGIHIFRRRLENSNISGVYVNHPGAGDCVLVNYSDDVYRQRFTAAHEAAHAIFDREEQVIVSFWNSRDLREIRANTFASRFLLPPAFLNRLPDPQVWNSEKLIRWANELRVNTEPLLIALADARLIDQATHERLRSIKVPLEVKQDPELPSSLAPNCAQRKRELLERGLSTYYVSLCFDAYRQDLMTATRLAELFMLDSDRQLRELALIYNEPLDAS